MANVRAEDTRPTVIAGSWYPGTEKDLSRAVEGYLGQVDQPPIVGELLALISPHAGYVYSGQTAAYAYRQLRGQQVDTVVLMGPSHRSWVGDWAVSAHDAYETPLGAVPLDHSFIGELDGRVSLRHVRGDVEHSLEIQLPFLQHELGAFDLVPLMTSADDPEAAEELADALVAIIHQHADEGGRVLLVASSDLHHIDRYDEVVRRDKAVVDAVAAYDLERLTSLLMAPGCSVCGRMPILTMLRAAKSLGADRAEVLHYTNSGDVTGQRRPGQYTVGYMAAAAYRSQR